MERYVIVWYPTIVSDNIVRKTGGGTVDWEEGHA
jgi:hypothetical protein